ncbi:hypothetical protein DI487_02405 [Flavobacterium sediminis]|uniref:Cell surface protein n=1 Tax=Flavobacterium sediminis TaxID=2201181 RepID=A0A2U8QYU9_9FLAO|nr:hypothetical protein DI487_02405 [Flavobacterium sediminis]
MRKISLLAATIALFFASCSNDDDNNQEQPEPAVTYENGIFILNEGNYGVDNSTVSFLADDFSFFQADAYGAVNNEGVGNTGQSIGFYNTMAFIVVNGSNKIEIVNRYTLEPIGTVSSGLSNPRYIAFANDKAYVTNWGDASSATDDYVAVLNTTTYAVEATIPVGEGPERIEEENGKLYVALKGGWNNGNAVVVIDSATDTVTTTITVGDVPNSLATENGYLYVLCGGITDWTGGGGDTNGVLVTIDLSDNTFTTLDFPTGHPANLDIENGTIYYTINAAVYSMSTSATTLPSTPILSVADQGVYGIYGFQVEGGKVYIGDAADYSSNGSIYIFNTSGTLLYENTVRVSPNGFYFNN